ncbi:MAG: beta-ketoacyl-[acyl-carrier-protein] synthase family protein [Planctomycetaceae bacterium]
MKRRAVVTGIGCVTPIGTNTREFADSLYAGRIGVGRLTVFDAEHYPVQIAAEVRNWDVSQVGLNPAQWQNCPRQTSFAMGAGLQAAHQASLADARIDPSRFGVYLGCGEPFEDFTAFTRAVHDTQRSQQPFVEHALRIFDPDAEREYEPDMPAMHLARLLHAGGPVANCVSACVSSTQAIGEACRMIQFDEADVMLCGGAHSTINPFGVTGFQRLSALSTRNDDPQGAVRPFDADRDGFVIGEGAALFVVEELEHARRRGAEILGEITGYGSGQDAYRVTDTHPEGRGAVKAMQRALQDANLVPDQINYINAHGTGTPLNDRVETLAIKQAFGQQAYHIPVSSTKSMLGHATTACGAIELAVCLLSLQSGVIPPTMNHDSPDPDCDLDYVPKQPREIACRHLLTNNVAFGGQNAALIVSRFDESSPATVRVRWAA